MDWKVDEMSGSHGGPEQHWPITRPSTREDQLGVNAPAYSLPDCQWQWLTGLLLASLTVALSRWNLNHEWLRRASASQQSQIGCSSRTDAMMIKQDNLNMSASSASAWAELPQPRLWLSATLSGRSAQTPGRRACKQLPWCPVPSRHCTFTFMLIAAGWWSKSLSVSQWLFITSDSDDCHSLSLLEWPWRLSQRYMWLQRTCQFPVCRTWTFAARVFLVCAASCSYAVWALSSWFNLGFSSWAFAWAFVVLSWSIETSFPE